MNDADLAPSRQPSSPIPVRGRIAMACSKLANERGLYLGRRSTRIHVAIYRLSRGKLGAHVPGLPAARILLLHHTGARTGRRRTSPLMYHEDGEVVAVAASKAGQPTNPAWFHNLMANPHTTIQIGSEIRAVQARIATAAERDRLWPEFVSFYPLFTSYQRNARGREIPIVVLEPDQSEATRNPVSGGPSP